jgi:hypothetical protein
LLNRSHNALRVSLKGLFEQHTTRPMSHKAEGFFAGPDAVIGLRLIMPKTVEFAVSETGAKPEAMTQKEIDDMLREAKRVDELFQQPLNLPPLDIPPVKADGA